MKGVLWLGVILLLFPIATALTSYIDEEITLQPNGDAYVRGTTNVDFLTDLHPENNKVNGLTSDLTTKKGKHWLFTLSPQGNITASLVKVRLPKGSVINYIKSNHALSISTSNDIITLAFSGDDSPAIQVQYSITPLQSTPIFWAWIFGGLSVALAVLLAIKRSKKSSKLDLLRPTLNETQIKIIDALLEKGGEASQTTLQYMTNTPKASLSRNVEILAQKEIVQKFFNGTSNYIKIHPKMK